MAFYSSLLNLEWHKEERNRFTSPLRRWLFPYFGLLVPLSPRDILILSRCFCHASLLIGTSLLSRLSSLIFSIGHAKTGRRLSVLVTDISYFLLLCILIFRTHPKSMHLPPCCRTPCTPCTTAKITCQTIVLSAVIVLRCRSLSAMSWWCMASSCGWWLPRAFAVS